MKKYNPPSISGKAVFTKEDWDKYFEDQRKRFLNHQEQDMPGTLIYSNMPFKTADIESLGFKKVFGSRKIVEGTYRFYQNKKELYELVMLKTNAVRNGSGKEFIFVLTMVRGERERIVSHLRYTGKKEIYIVLNAADPNLFPDTILQQIEPKIT